MWSTYGKGIWKWYAARQTACHRLIEVRGSLLHFKILGFEICNESQLCVWFRTWGTRFGDEIFWCALCDFGLHSSATKRPRVFFRKVDLPKDSSAKCKKRVFEAVSMVEVIKHLENPRHTSRQIKSLLKDRRITFCLHADASYLWLRFFFYR